MKLNLYFKKLYLSYYSKKYSFLFLEQLIILLELEIQLSDCFKILGKKSTNKFIQNLSMSLYHDLLLGLNLENTLQKHPYFFTPWLHAIISLSKQNNLLKNSLKRYLKHHQQIKKLKNQLIQQLIYPILIFIACICLLYFYNYQILPSYQNLFKHLNGSAPRAFNLDALINKIIYMIPILIIILNTKIQDRIPLWGNLNQQYRWYNWFSLMKISMESGMTFHNTLIITEPLIKDKIQKKWHKELLQSIEYGQYTADIFSPPPSFPQIIKQYFDLFILQMESPQFYKKISKILEQNLESILNTLQKYLPLFALTIMSIFSGYILFIFYQPLLKLGELI